MGNLTKLIRESLGEEAKFQVKQNKIPRVCSALHTTAGVPLLTDFIEKLNTTSRHPISPNDLHALYIRREI